LLVRVVHPVVTPCLLAFGGIAHSIAKLAHYPLSFDVEAFEVTLDYLVDETAMPTFDKKTVNRLKDIQALTDEDKNHVFALLDAFLTKTKLQGLL
jgi:hypothetical protein